MKYLSIVCLIIAPIAVFSLLDTGGLTQPAATQGNEKTAEQVYKNIQLFKGMPASQLLGAMNFMAGSLGVSCDHCHVPNQFAKDDKPAKQTARLHLQMTRTMNDANFGGKTVVNCVTCHRGLIHPASALTIAKNTSEVLSKNSASSAQLPTVDQVLVRYLVAMGGSTKLEKIKTLEIRGTREMKNGGDAPSREQLEIYRKAPNKLLMNFSIDGKDSTQAFNGTIGWRRFNGRVSNIGGPDLLGARRDADIFKDIKFREQYVSLNLVGIDEIGGRNAFVIEARFPDTHPAKMFGIESEKLYFDAQSGLLVRRYMEYPTPLGMLPEATDYTNYQKVNGLMFPFSIRLSRPPLVVTQSFVEIKINTVITDEVFEKPPT